MKKLLILQIIGVFLFSFFSILLYVTGTFSVTSVIVLYIIMGIGNVANARNMLMKPIEEISVHDKLTGCYNRVKLDNKIPEYENYSNYAIIFFDVNNLKKMNDIHGHDDGDKLLIDASNQLRFWHEYGDLYRLGGDEFIVVVPNVSKSQLESILTMWHKEQPVLNQSYNDDFVCDFSYGVYYKTPFTKLSFNEIMSNADNRMYKMKTELKKQRKD